MSIATTARHLADNLLTKFGETVTLHWRPPAVFDPATDTAHATPVAFDCSAVVIEYGTRDVGDLVKLGDFKVQVPAAALPSAPDAASWTITIRGHLREILGVQTAGAMGLDACYLVTAKGAR